MLPPYPTKNTVPGAGRYEKSQSVRSTFDDVGVDSPGPKVITSDQESLRIQNEFFAKIRNPLNTPQ